MVVRGCLFWTWGVTCWGASCSRLDGHFNFKRTSPYNSTFTTNIIVSPQRNKQSDKKVKDPRRYSCQDGSISRGYNFH